MSLSSSSSGKILADRLTAEGGLNLDTLGGPCRLSFILLTSLTAKGVNGCDIGNKQTSHN